MADQIKSPEIELEDKGSKGRYFLRSPAGLFFYLSLSRFT